MRGIYRGFTTSCCGVFMYRGLYFGIYEALYPYTKNIKRNDKKFAINYCISIIAGIASYPFETVRRRQAMTSATDFKYKSSWHCCNEILKTQGLKALFHGCTINVVRSVSGTAFLMAYDILKEYKNITDAHL